MREKKQIVSITLRPHLIEQIDAERGSSSRSSFIEKKLMESLEINQIRQLVLESCDQILDFLAEKTPPNAPQDRFSYHAFMVVREIENRLNDLRAGILSRRSKL